MNLTDNLTDAERTYIDYINSIPTNGEVEAKYHCSATYTLSDFAEQLASGIISEDDGEGYFVDREGKEDRLSSVFTSKMSWIKAVKQFPFVNWYSK